MSEKFFDVVQLWDSTKLPRRLMEHVQRDESNGSIRYWTVRGEDGPSDDPGYGPENYGAKHIEMDREVDDWLVERGAMPGTEIVWHVWW